MEIDKQLFEDVLSGKLKGTFVFRNQLTCNSDGLIKNNAPGYRFMYPYSIKGWSYTSNGMFNLNTQSNYDIINFIPDMKENELTIEIPEGKEIDWKQSEKENKIVLKDKQLTYEDICKKLFEDNHYTIAWEGYPIKCCGGIYNASNATTKHQLECILAKNMLANVAKYLNDGCNLNDDKYYVIVYGYGKDAKKPRIEIIFKDTVIYGFIVFKTKELAQQAIEILGEETIKLALEPLGF